MKRKSVSRMRRIFEQQIHSKVLSPCLPNAPTLVISECNYISFSFLFFYNTEETFGSQWGLIFSSLVYPFSHWEDVSWKIFIELTLSLKYEFVNKLKENLGNWKTSYTVFISEHCLSQKVKSLKGKIVSSCILCSF